MAAYTAVAPRSCDPASIVIHVTLRLRAVIGLGLGQPGKHDRLNAIPYKQLTLYHHS